MNYVCNFHIGFLISNQVALKHNFKWENEQQDKK